MENRYQCLVLNADYTPLNIINWERAVKLFLKKEYGTKADLEFIAFYNSSISTVNTKYKIPAVIKTTKYFNIVQQHVKFSRKNLFLRDNFTCQYCGIKKDIAELTYDHIIPKSQWDYNKGNPTHWLNITTACIKCNRQKRNRNPVQAKMPLITSPTVPRKTGKYLPSLCCTHSINIPDQWLIYIK